MALAQTTQTGIYNRALALLGSTERVSGPDDTKPVTRHLNEHWPMSVRTVLASHPWNCCIGRAQLNRGDAPVFGEGYTYELPADCLRWLPWSQDSDHYYPAVEEGGVLICDGPEQLPIRYIRLIDDPSRWSPHMAEAMAFALAWHAAEAITQSTSIARAREEAYHGSDGEGGMLAKAKMFDGLATGDRDRGGVVARSRTLSAARGVLRGGNGRWW